MQILRNSEDYPSGKLQGFSYHGYSNRLVFNILIGAECYSGLGDKQRNKLNQRVYYKLVRVWKKR